jgi:hypothetical protein
MFERLARSERRDTHEHLVRRPTEFVDLEHLGHRECGGGKSRRFLVCEEVRQMTADPDYSIPP